MSFLTRDFSALAEKCKAQHQLTLAEMSGAGS